MGDVPQIFEGHQVLPKPRSTRSSLGMHTVSMDNCSFPIPAADANDIDKTCGGTAEGVSVDVDPETVLQDHFYTEKICEMLQHTVGELNMRVKELEGRLETTHIELVQSKKELNARRISYASMKDDSVVFKFYTGVSVATFDNIKAVLQNSPEGMDYSGTKEGEHDGRGVVRTARKLSVDDELLLVLIKLRHNFPESDLGNRFTVSQPTVSRIFSTWVHCLYHAFKEINIWPSRRLVDLYMPVAFKEKYSSTRVVIDCTEFKIEKPVDPDVQAETWSSYKNGNTFKLLVGVTPVGVISFLSPLWGGRISDKGITKRSSLLDKLEPGDSIMADRGFDIDAIMPEGGAVNIPPFLEARSQFEENELVATRRIARLRIHVERAIERIKNFQITHFFHACLCPLAEPILFVYAFLTILSHPFCHLSQIKLFLPGLFPFKRQS